MSILDKINTLIMEAAFFIYSLVALLIVLFVAKAVFSISRFLSYQKAQTLLLGKIAKQLGVPSKQVENVILERLFKQRQSGNITDIVFERERERLLGS